MLELLSHPEIVAAVLGGFFLFVAWLVAVIWRISRIEARQDMLEERYERLDRDVRQALDRMDIKMDKNFETIISLIKKND